MPEYMCPHCHAVFRERHANCPNDGSILIEVPVLTDLSGKVLKQKYRLEEALGHGGFGSVYKATHLVLGKPVAVKVLRAEFRSDSTMVARFFNEARVVTRLTNPHTINTFDLDQAEEGFLFMVMDYVEGQTLRQLARQFGDPPGRLPWPRTIQLLLQVCDSLEEAHRAGVVHRDLKPDNIMISNRGGAEDFVTVLDFGIAKVIEGTDMQNLTAAGMLLGSPAYMSPEQVKGDPLGPLSDIYALGVIAYQVLSGLLPVTARQTAALLQEKILSRPETLSRKVPGLELPLELEHLVMTMLEVDESLRPASAALVKEKLATILRASGGPLSAGISVSGMPTESRPSEGTVGYEAQASAPGRPTPSPEKATSALPDATATPPSSPVDHVPTQVPGVVTRSAAPNRRLIGALAVIAVVLVAIAVGLAVGLGGKLRGGTEKGAPGETVAATADATTALPGVRPALDAVVTPEELGTGELQALPGGDITLRTMDLGSVDITPPVDATGQVPLVVEKQDIEARPTVPEKQPTVPEKRPTVPEKRPTVPEKRPTVPEKRPTVPEKRPTVPEKQPPVSEKRPTVPEKQPPVSEKRPPVPEKQPPVLEKPSTLESIKSPVDEKAIVEEVEKALEVEMKGLEEEVNNGLKMGLEKNHIDNAFDELDEEDPW
jgi:serine/threonine protein kinase